MNLFAEIDVGAGRFWSLAQIQAMCVRVREEFGTSALEPVASKFEQVGVVGEGERLGGILFDDEHRESLGLQHCQGFEDDLDKPRREAERGFTTCSRASPNDAPNLPERCLAGSSRWLRLPAA